MSDSAGTIEEIVREVFIDPIRTVLVIDDEFPTLDGFIANELAASSSPTADKREIEQVRDILKFARTKTRPWLVDVHDGKKESGIAPYLHHSDLLILDYHLEGEDKGGTAAVEILRKLAANDHFNLVIVYTKGEAGLLEGVLREVAIGLTSRQDGFNFSAEQIATIRDDLERWEEKVDGISQILGEELTDQLFLEMLNFQDMKLVSVLGVDCGQRLKQLFIEGSKLGVQIDKELILRWLLSAKRTQLLPQLCEADLGPIRIKNTEECCWLSSEKLFLTILAKGRCPPAQFEEKLLAAITSSYPSPHRLLITKMRAEIDERGLIAEATILRDKDIQTAWLNDFLNPDPADVTSVVASTVDRHWEALGDHLRTSLFEFGDKLRTRFRVKSLDEVMSSCGLSKSLLNDEATLARYNCYMSTKSSDRSHLTTGHTFSIINNVAGVETINHWICLSPACDMVPGQKSDGWHERLGSSIPFVAVRLFSISSNVAVKNATKNTVLFLEINQKIQTFSIYKDASSTALPEWEQMFAANFGRFSAGKKLSLTSILGTGDLLRISVADATVTAQLRSEYALNLLQRIGGQLSRPGLGMHFKGRPIT